MEEEGVVTDGEGQDHQQHEVSGSTLKSRLKCLKCSCGKIEKWTIIRFGVIFVGAILILCIIYGLKSAQSEKDGSSVVDFAFSIGDKLYADNLWLFIEVESDDQGLRTAQSIAMEDHICSAVRAGKNVGWTPLVTGGRPSCCRSTMCRHLHPQDLKHFNLKSTKYFLKKYDYSSALKAGGFLAAMKQGAIVIFHANPEVYYLSGVEPTEFQKQLEYQLRKLTLGVSVGLVKGREPDFPNAFNPYSHFIPNLGNASNRDNFRYKVCEKEPPAMEKFLDNDGYSMDLSAPSLTLPGRISAPFDTRNTAFARSAFWSLLVLPDIEDVRSPRELNEKAIYVFRSIMAQAILSAIGGSTEFSVSQVATLESVLEDEIPKDLISLAKSIDSWKCRFGSALRCLNALAHVLEEKKVISDSNFKAIELWIEDLNSIGYEDVPTIKPSADPLYPCIEHDALVGVYFNPSVIQNLTNVSPSSPTSHLIKVVQRLCPSLDQSYLTSTLADKSNKHENIALIITFTDKQYNNLPIFEALYRHHFKNILYCGDPSETVSQYREQYSAKQGTSFSFLPARKQPGYECLLAALEMGYNVDGFLIVDQKTLINPWNFKEFNSSTIWHGNIKERSLNREALANATDISPLMIQSIAGIVKALSFLETVLLKPSKLSSTLAQVTRGRGRNSIRRQKRSKGGEGGPNPSLTPPEFSISLFGELYQENRTLLHSQTPDQDVSELLLDPANFHRVDAEENEEPYTSSINTQLDNINLLTAFDEIERLFRVLDEKLNLWLKIVSSTDIISSVDLEAVKDVQCDITSNYEICETFAVFLRTLKLQEMVPFRLIYDDLPVYYVPSFHKEKLFLLANLFIRFDIDEKMALPILLRGLGQIVDWINLKHAPINNGTVTETLQNPEDLLYLSDGVDDNRELLELESAHYLYPVDVKSILTNEGLKTITCRNYGS